MSSTLEITGLTRFKNAALFKVVKALGSQAAVAREIGVEVTRFGEIINLKRFPNFLYDYQDPRTIKLEALLLEHAGKSIEQVFPEVLKGKKFKTKVVEQTKEVPTENLISYHSKEAKALDFQPEIEVELDLKKIESWLVKLAASKKGMPKRNLNIFLQRVQGLTYNKIAGNFGLTTERIRAISIQVARKLANIASSELDLGGVTRRQIEEALKGLLENKNPASLEDITSGGKHNLHKHKESLS